VRRAALSAAEAAGRVVSEREVVRAASHARELSPRDAALRARLEEIYGAAALEAPTLDDALARAAADSGVAPDHARKIFRLLTEDGTLVRVTAELYFHRDALARLVGRLREYADGRAADRLIDVAAFKDLAKVSRKYAIPLLEYLDRERVTRRAGDRRLVL
jgi:selenocysteine-specific elongation factor